MAERPWLVRLEWALAVALCVAVASTIWAVPYLMSNDGPQHSFVAYVGNHFHDPGTDWALNYTLSNPDTSNGYVQIVRALEPYFGLWRSHQIFICFVVSFWGWAWFIFLRSQLGAGRLLSLVAFPCSLQWILWIGLYPFFLASCFFPILVALGRSAVSTGEKRRYLASSVLFCLVAWIHSFAAILIGFALFAIVVIERRSLRSALQVAVIGAPSVVYVARFSVRSQMLEHANGTYWEASYRPLDVLYEYFLPGDDLQLVLFSVLILSALWRLRYTRNPLVAVGLLLLAFGTLMPVSASGWELVRPRLVPPAFMLILAGLVGVDRRAWIVCALCLAGFCGLRIDWARTYNTRSYEEVKPLVDAVSGVKMHGETWVYLASFGPDEPVARQVLDASSAFHVAQLVAPNVGGVPYFSHTIDPTIHHLVRRQFASPHRWMGEHPTPAWLEPTWSVSIARRARDLQISTLLADLTWVDAVLMYGLPGDQEVLEELGYTVEVTPTNSDGGEVLLVARWQGGCALNVYIDAPPQDVVMYVGFGEMYCVRDAHIVRTGQHVTLNGLPCGPSWMSTEYGCVEQRGNPPLTPVMPAKAEIQTVTCTLPEYQAAQLQ